MTCTGYPNSTGFPLDNVWLGKLRAESVCAALHADGIRSAASVIVSKGQTDPRAINAAAAGRALNRRIEIRLEYEREHWGAG